MWVIVTMNHQHGDADLGEHLRFDSFTLKTEHIMPGLGVHSA